jgi:hypothetical protein
MHNIGVKYINMKLNPYTIVSPYIDLILKSSYVREKI